MSAFGFGNTGSSATPGSAFTFGANKYGHKYTNYMEETA